MQPQRERAVEVLTAPERSGIVDLVAWPEGAGDARSVVVANADGASRLRPDGSAEVLHGRDPVARTDPLAFLPYEAELADPSPPNARNAYPLAGTRLSSFFADPGRSPDLAVVHTPRHYFPNLGGHVGEHGSLDAVQSRAPLLLSGAGVTSRGLVDDWARVVDVAPTLAWLVGADPTAVAPSGGDTFRDAAGMPLDGRLLTPYVAPAARWVVGLLWDGSHCGELLRLAGAGELPALARLLEHGCALRGGAVAEFPSVTLTNHTSALTGVGPGRHGVLGNVYYDRETARRVVPNDARTWHRSADWLRPGVRTVFEQVRESRPDARTASINEAVDRGATDSTMSRVRELDAGAGAGGLGSLLPDPTTSPFLGERAHLDDPSYAWATQVDDIGLQQVLQLWQRAESAPALTWWSTVVTDSGHHAGGPRSAIATDAFRDADRRLGAFLAHLDRLGVTDDVVFLLTADHGFEGSDPACCGDWGDALRAAGVDFRDEGPGFVYLG